MPALRFEAMPTATARALQAGGLDAFGMLPERHISDGDGNPCRHCLNEIPEGRPFLILAYRPFDTFQPYAETGPIFLCAGLCERHPDSSTTPEMFLGWERLLVKGYSFDHRIVYGTGGVVPASEVAARSAEILERPDIAYVDLRSAQYNCFQARVFRG